MLDPARNRKIFHRKKNILYTGQTSIGYRGVDNQTLHFWPNERWAVPTLYPTCNNSTGVPGNEATLVRPKIKYLLDIAIFDRALLVCESYHVTSLKYVLVLAMIVVLYSKIFAPFYNHATDFRKQVLLLVFNIDYIHDFMKINPHLLFFINSFTKKFEF